ncbi:MAG: PilZ domain-containing protein [Nitrospiraceae bacterium]
MITTGFHLREYRRFPVHCGFYYSNDEVQGAGTVWNLSVSGWRVDGTNEVQTGMVFTLLVMLPEYYKTIIIERAIVRWTRGREFGLQIGAIHHRDTGRLKEFVSSLM